MPKTAFKTKKELRRTWKKRFCDGLIFILNANTLTFVDRNKKRPNWTKLSVVIGADNFNEFLNESENLI